MNTTMVKTNTKTLVAELQWLTEVIDTRLKLYFGKTASHKAIYDIQPPDLSNDDSSYAQLVAQHTMSFKERIVLILALTPHIKPQLLDVFFIKNADYDRTFTEFGGRQGNGHAGFIPTGETAAFILAIDDLEERFSVTALFGKDHFFQHHKILYLGNPFNDEAFLSGVLKIGADYLNYLTSGEKNK